MDSLPLLLPPFFFCCSFFLFLLLFVVFVAFSNQIRSSDLLHTLCSTYAASSSLDIHHVVSCVSSLEQIGFVDPVSSKLNVLSSIGLLPSCATPPCSPTPQLLNDAHLFVLTTTHRHVCPTRRSAHFVLHAQTTATVCWLFCCVSAFFFTFHVFLFF